MDEVRQDVGWQPIETAPKDGTDILVCVTHNLPDDEWETIQWVDWRRGDDVVWPRYWERIDIPFPPTHWMPLPEPPDAHPTLPEQLPEDGITIKKGT